VGLPKNIKNKIKVSGSGGIRTRAHEWTGALIQRLRPLGHATVVSICRISFALNIQMKSEEGNH
jgi:hypothetical protein